MMVKDIKGLKYPDEYIVKYFFKKKLLRKGGKVLEFGCANGNNLSLFYQYDLDVTGVDKSNVQIDNAKYNFQSVYQSAASAQFYCEDMIDFARRNKNFEADIFMIPNVISYLSKPQFIKFLELSIANKLFKKEASFFLRTRTRKDYRYGLGPEIEPDTFLMENDVTGEIGTICTCYEEHELISILQKYLNLKNFEIFHLDNQNLHGGHVVLNADIVIWGEIE